MHYILEVVYLSSILRPNERIVYTRRYQTFLLISVLFLSGCFDGAPRNHPLDPRGDAFNDKGTIILKVTNFYPPLNGLADARVRLTPGTYLGQTDADGALLISGLDTGIYEMTVEKEGYAAFRQPVEVHATETTTLDVPLPAVPVITQLEIATVHISRWWPPPEELFRIEIQAGIEDRDGLNDIERVWIEIPDFNYADTFSVAPITPGSYTHVLRANQLPVSLPALLGHDIIVYARDRTQKVSSSNPQKLFRIIDKTPLAGDPQGLALLPNARPVFHWEPLTLDYPFIYRVDVTRVDENIQSVVASISDISSDSTSVTITAPLSSGEYFWTVSIIDAFGNRSRSREAGFRIP